MPSNCTPPLPVPWPYPPWDHIPPGPYPGTTEAGGTYPTGMHSCLTCVFAVDKYCGIDWVTPVIVLRLSQPALQVTWPASNGFYLRGGCLPLRGGLHPGESTCRGVWIQGRLPPWGLGRPPSQSQLQKRAVRTLLECFLVKNPNSFQCSSKAENRTRKNNLLRLTKVLSSSLVWLFRLLSYLLGR